MKLKIATRSGRSFAGTPSTHGTTTTTTKSRARTMHSVTVLLRGATIALVTWMLTMYFGG